MTISSKDFLLGVFSAFFFICGYEVATIQGHYQHDIDHEEYRLTVDKLESKLLLSDARAAEAVTERDEALRRMEEEGDE